MRKPKIKKPGSFRSLSVTITVSFLILSLTVLLAASVLEIYFNFQNQQKSIDKQQQFIAQEAANTAKSFIQEKFSILETVAYLSNLINVRREEKQLVLEKLLGIEPAFRQVILLDSQKKELAKTSRLSTTVSFQITKQVGNTLFSEVNQGKKYIGPVYINEITSEPMVIMAVPVKNILGDLEGTLIAEVNLKFMWDVIDKIKIGNKGLAYVVDKQGRLLAFGDIGRVLKEENLAGLKEVKDFMGKGEPLTGIKIEILKGINNTYVVTTHVPLGMPDWAVVVELPVREAYASVIRMFKITAWVIFLGVILTVFVSIRLSKQITTPIVELRDVTKKISAGDLNTKIKVESKDEIGDLADSFNQMIEDLNKTTVSRDRLAQEVIERKRAEEKLQESEERFRSIFDNSNDGILVADTTTRKFLLGNQTICRMLDYTPDEITRLGVENIHPQKDLPAVTETFEKQVRQEIKLAILPIQRKNGSVFYADVNSFPFKMGNKTYLVGVFRDITERRQIEEALKESEERFRTTVETSPDVYMCFDMSMHITLINQQGTKVIGYERPEDIIGKNAITEFVAKEDWGKAAEEAKKVIKSGTTAEPIELIIIRKDGSRFLGEIKASLMVDTKKNPTGFVLVIRDITERKKTEDRLKHYAADLKRANEEVKEFAYIVSHDLRAPLVNIKGFAAELRSTLKTIDSALNAALPHLDQKEKQEVTDAFRKDVPEALSFIDSSATNMDGFINSLLKLSRMGRREMTFEPLNLAEIVETTLKGLAHQLEERRAKVTVGPLPEIIGDRTAIEQIVGNLLSNAVKYLDPDRLGEIEVTGERNEEETTLVIRDNGRGIAKEDTPRVFMPFRRFGRQDTKGEGMGLAFAHTLVHRHNGNIRCESESGAGTTFTVTLSNHPEQGG